MRFVNDHDPLPLLVSCAPAMATLLKSVPQRNREIVIDFIRS
jgi:hypothetical protein